MKEIRLALEQGELTYHILELSTANQHAVKRTVALLEAFEIIRVNPERGQIILNKTNPYDSFGQAYNCYMRIRGEFLEAYAKGNPTKYEQLKDGLRIMSPEKIRDNGLAILYSKVFRGEAAAAKKIEKIKKAVAECREDNLYGIDLLYHKKIADEMLYFIMFSREKATEAVPQGFITKAGAISSFGQIGYEDEDVQYILKFWCDARILCEDPDSKEKRYSVLVGPKILLKARQ